MTGMGQGGASSKPTAGGGTWEVRAGRAVAGAPTRLLAMLRAPGCDRVLVVAGERAWMASPLLFDFAFEYSLRLTVGRPWGDDDEAGRDTARTDRRPRYLLERVLVQVFRGARREFRHPAAGCARQLAPPDRVPLPPRRGGVLGRRQARRHQHGQPPDPALRLAVRRQSRR